MGMDEKLIALEQENAKLRKLAYIGEHEFPEQTWKVRCLECHEDSKALKQANVELRAALQSALLLLEHGDFSNGVTDPTGMIDEGRVKAQEMIAEIRQVLL